MFLPRLLLAGLSAVALAGGTPLSAGESSSAPPILVPSLDIAKERAHLIFNAIQSAGRQWGASINHNGFGFFPAVMPEGTVLYHGSRWNVPPPGPEWLAFEVEHSESFASSIKLKPGERPPVTAPGPGRGPRKPEGDMAGPQKPLGGTARSPDSDDKNDDEGKDGDDSPRYTRGYLHTYRANRDLNLLYVDGMSAGKGHMGTLDSQDLVLRIGAQGGAQDEWYRAVEICDLITGWGYEGFVRTEIGFEVIYCNFTTGVDFVSQKRTFIHRTDHDSQGYFPKLLHWARAAAERYDGLGGDRLRIDFSSMVSGLFFPMNISSTDPERPDLLRLAAASPDDLGGLKRYLQRVACRPRRFTVNWQGVVDMIVARYSERLLVMASNETRDYLFVKELEGAAYTYLEAPTDPGDVEPESNNDHNATAAAMQSCREAYFIPVIGTQEQWGLEDKLIYTALGKVMHDICSTLYIIQTALVEAAPDPTTNFFINTAADNEEYKRALKTSRGLAADLVEQLSWVGWKKARLCPVGRVNFVAMWPFGSVEDHWHPGCRNEKDLPPHPGNYWGSWN